MQRYFVLKNEKNNFILSEQDQIHIKKVMRMKINDEIVCIENKLNYLSRIEKLEPLIVKKLSQIKNDTELPIKVTLLLAVIKPHNFEYAMQKCTELGVHRIIPVVFERSQKNLLKKSRLELIAKEASEQSYRNTIPIIEEAIQFEEIKSYTSDLNFFGITIKEDAKKLKDLNWNIKTCTITIGPEGGFSEKETNFLINNNFIPVSFCKTVLRSETAACHALSAINILSKES